MDKAKFDPALHVGYPKPLGLVHAADVALTIAAPLLTAGALSLIGVVCADADKFRWPGPTLLLLVLTVLSLITSIQLGYQARQYLYSYQDLKDWRAEEPEPKFVENQHTDYLTWLDKTFLASIVYNLGTVLLLLSVAAALTPEGTGPLALWRWITAGLILAATGGEALWSYSVYFPLRLARRQALESRNKNKKQSMEKAAVERSTAP
ncbi:hypothetical protein ACFZDJ_49280 [Streptomyces sp. NPDC007896]|uniref:hypothetical protein n=1 Tax=unclassified Streptomyces TaxID=2593676 RepID=UPI0036DFAD28